MSYENINTDKLVLEENGYINSYIITSTLIEREILDKLENFDNDGLIQEEYGDPISYLQDWVEWVISIYSIDDLNEINYSYEY